LAKKQTLVRTTAPERKIKTVKHPSGKTHSLRDPHWAKFLAFTKRETKESGWTLLKEKKGPSKEQIAAMQGASSLFVNPSVTYLFRLATTNVVTTTTSVETRGYMSWDPSQFSEYTNYLLFMFNQVRIRRAKITVCAEAGSGPIGYIMSSDMGYTATTPTSSQVVAENPNSFLFSSAYNAFGIYHLTVDVPGDYLWADVNSPSPETNVGCFGQFQFAQIGVATSAITAFSYLIELLYEFRSRT